MNDTIRLIQYANQCLKAFDDVWVAPCVPNVKVVIGEFSYPTKVYIGEDSADIVLHMPSISRDAEVQEIDLEQALIEAIFHSWASLLFFSAYPNADNMDSGYRDSILDVAIDNGFIHRRFEY